MKERINSKAFIFKVALLITFLTTIIITTVIMGSKNEVNAAYVYDATNTRWVFQVNSTTREITNLYCGALGSTNIEEVTIPGIINYNGVDYTVRSIGTGSSNKTYTFPKTVKRVIIPDTVTTINNYAFYSCTALESVTFGSGLDKIGNYAFAYSKKLESVTFPESLKTIGSNAFDNCNNIAGELVLPKGVTSVENYAFSGCSKIEKIKFGDGLSIDVLRTMYASLRSLNTLEVYDDSANYKVEDGVLFSKDGKRLYLSAKTEYNNYVVPEGVTSIERSAFEYATEMTGILTLPEGLQSIGNNAFYGKTGFTGKLRIPDTVVTIGSGAFYGTKGFEKVTIGSGVTRIESSTFSNLDDLFINNVIGSVELVSGYCNPAPVVHFLNSTKHVFVSKAPGVKLVNAETGAEIESGDYLDETTFKYKIEVENGYDYNHLELVWYDDNKYETFTNETVVNGKEYEFTPLLRARSIYVQNLNDSVDLSLRTFITEVNRNALAKSRVPEVNADGSFEYLHTKEPVKVKKGDLITYRVRIYNEALQIAKATEITMHIPEGMAFDAENTTNKNNGWIQDGNTIKTSQLAFDNIHSYLGNGVLNYKDVDICLTVTDDSTEGEVYKTVFSEITGMSGEDDDSTPGNVNVSQDYRIDEIINSNSSSFIVDQEDDDDFETIVLNSKIRVEYNLRIEKVDEDTDELLAGAKFELISAGVNEILRENELKRYEDEEIISTAVSDENGIVDFGAIITYGEGENIFWVKEIDAPSGYLTNIGKKMKVKVVKTILDEEAGTYSVKVYCESSSYKVDTSHYEFTPVTNAEQLAKIGSGETVNIDGVDYEYNVNSNYKLTNDIDLSGINWKPIDKSLAGIIDGDGHKISNLTIEIDDESTIAKVGLIGEFSGIIENLTLENPNIHIKTLAEGLEDTTDYYGVGGFVGLMKEGYIYNCKTTVTEGAEASITASIDNIGGFIGHTAPNGIVTIIDSENNVDVIGSKKENNEEDTSGNNSSNNYSDNYSSNNSSMNDSSNDSNTNTSVSDPTDPADQIPTNNVGGLIGCALGSISIQNSKNTADITCGKYGAGGLVGFVRPTDYEELSITAGYDEDNKRIDLLVENKAAKGQYNLTLEIRDRKTSRLIGGAIYEVDKVDDAIKTALIDTGTLKLFDKAIEYTGKDVYFMTEEESVPGYNALNGIIRVDIDRYWDNEKNEYKVRAEASIITHKDYLDFVGNRSTKEDEARTGQIFDRGAVFTDVNIERANWNGSKIEIVNCVNDGEIYADKSNAAGMIGTAYGVVTIDGCTNNGEIRGSKKTAGMVAEIKTVTNSYREWNEPEAPNPNPPQITLDYSIVANCTNNGKIWGQKAIGAAGGLLGEVMGNAKVTKGINNGEVFSVQQQTGGIVGKTYGAITIEDSINNANMSITASQSSCDSVLGGILGEAWLDEYGISEIKYAQVNSVIRNCKNNGNLTNNRGQDIGGIVGVAIGKSTTIENCEVIGKSAEEPIKIYSYDRGEVAGILAWSSCKNVTIRDCKVKNADIGIQNESIVENTVCNVAGIFAINDTGYVPANNAYAEAKRERTDISNCIVEDCKIINKSKEVSGIMGITNGSYGYISDDYIANIHDCVVRNSLIAMHGDHTYYPIVSGIYVGGYECKNFDIRYCNVEDSRLEIRGTTEDSYNMDTATVGGIFGRAQNALKSNIEECNVINTTLYNKNKKSRIYDSVGNTGGIFGTIYGVNGNLSIRNSNVKNSKIIEYNANAGGIVGGLMSSNYNDQTITTTIEKCNVIETDITRLGSEEDNITKQGSTISASNDACVGGIAGSIQDIANVYIKDVNVIGKDIARAAEDASDRNVISSKCGNIGGVVGMTRNNTMNISNVVIKNYDVINDVYENKSNMQHAQIGGVLGSLWYRSNKDSFKDILVENVNVKGNKTMNTAGFVANFYSNEDSIIDNVDIKNTYIASKYTFGDGEKYGTIGGLVAVNGCTDEFRNCDVKDCIISSRKHLAAGGIAYNIQGINATNCNIENVEIRDDWEEPERIEDVVENMDQHRNYAGFIGMSTELTKLENIKVSNVDINARYASIGGIYGYVVDLGKLNNCTVEDCEFVSTKSISGVKGACAGIGATTIKMRGEANSNKVSNVKITTDNHINSGMFGYIKEGSEGIKINNPIVDNVTLTHENKDLMYNNEYYEDDSTRLIEYNPTMAGVVGITEDDMAINDATVKNSTLEVKSGDSATYTHVGGIIALTNAKVSIDNSKVIKTSITNNTNSSITGGFVGLNARFMSAPERTILTKITNSSIEQNSNITANNQIGGLVGYAPVELENDKVLNTTIKVKQFGYIGGVIGLANENTNTNTISKITVKDLTIPDGDALPTHAGGIAAQFSGTLKNSTVTDSTIVANQCASGVVAIYENPRSGGTSEIEDVTATNVDVISKASIASGIAAVAPGKIEKARVYNSTIETKGTNMAGGIVGTSNNTITDVIVEGTNITSQSSSASAGGVGACLYGAVSNAKVKDSNVKAFWNAGGIASTTMSSIEDAEVDNVEVISSIQSAGGVVGCTNGAITNASVKDSTVKGNLMAGGVAGFGLLPISEVEVNNTSVYAVEDAGGVVGVVNATITGATVTESTIKAKKLAGGIAGTMEAEIKNATVDGSTITSEELHVGGIVACTRATLDNCSTKNSTIKTLSGSFGSGSSIYPTCLGGLVGAGSGDSPSIINSTVENNTLTGATGTIVGKYIGAPTEINEQLVAGE